jgi:cytochrome c553
MNVVSRGLLLLLATACLVGFLAPLGAAPTAEQREELVAAANAVKKGGDFYNAGKFKESGEAIKDAQARLEKLAETEDRTLLSQVITLHKRLTKAHALLELEGVKLPELKVIESLTKPVPKPGDKPAAADAGAVSFTKQVAPVLVARCGGCHVRQMRGEFSMANYNNLMKGSKAGKVIFPSDAAGSAIVEQIESKSMPPNGSGIPDGELALLKKWITEGAKFDGPDMAAQLTALTGGAKPVEAPMLQVAQATGKESTSFARDVAPVLAETCTGCHGDMNPRNNFSLTTFERLLRTGDNGPVMSPGKPADSLLIKKLKGTGPGQRMPAQRDPLPDAVIAKIEKWIEEGAKFDGGDAKSAIALVAALYKAQKSTHEELTADRAKLADSNWRLSMADFAAERAETKDLYIVGNVGTNEISDLSNTAQAIVPKIAEIFKAPADQPFVKGRMTLFVFARGYDYSEIGRMVERRDIPQSSKGHFRFTVIDAYAAFPVPKADYSLEGVLAEQIGGCYVAALGSGTVPQWFAEGCGRVAASRLADDARIRSWSDAVAPVVGSMSKPDDFQTGKLDQDQTGVAAYSFVAFLMKDTSRFQKLMGELRAGKDFTQSFAAVYGGSPGQAAEIWVRKPPAPKPLKRSSKA